MQAIAARPDAAATARGIESNFVLLSLWKHRIFIINRNIWIKKESTNSFTKYSYQEKNNKSGFIIEHVVNTSQLVSQIYVYKSATIVLQDGNLCCTGSSL